MPSTQFSCNTVSVVTCMKHGGRVNDGNARQQMMEPSSTPKLYTKNPNAQLKAVIDAGNNKVYEQIERPRKESQLLTRGRDVKSRKGKTKALYFWSVEEVNKWLRKYSPQLHQVYGELFRQHEITGRTLMRLTDCKLQIIGISDSQHREELMRQILRTKLKTDTQELKVVEQRGNAAPLLPYHGFFNKK